MITLTCKSLAGSRITGDGDFRMRTFPVLSTHKKRGKVLWGGKSGGQERAVIPHNPLLRTVGLTGSVPPSLCFSLGFVVAVFRRFSARGRDTCLSEM